MDPHHRGWNHRTGSSEVDPVTAVFANPYVRLAGRALVAGLISAVVQLHSSSDTRVAWHSAIVAGGLAFCEVFTPLNALVGVFKKAPQSSHAH